MGLLLGLAWAGPAAATVCDTYSISSASCYGPNNGRAGDVTTQGVYNGDLLQSYACETRAHDGYEKSVPFSCHYSNFVTLQLEATSPVVGGCDVDFFLLGDTCSPTADCIDGDEELSGPGRIHTMTFWCERGRQYYVVAEDDPRARGDNLGTPGVNEQVCYAFLSPAGGIYYGSQFTVKPFCTESCTDGFDNDRDALVDCADADCAVECCDRDRDGEPSESPSCGGDDCDDDDPFVNPGELETPADGVDQDCDGLDDCYVDGDGDGYGSGLTVVGNDLDCDDPGEANDDFDCDDADRAVRPGVVDPPADGVDQDCSGGDTCWLDADRDGYGSTATTASLDLDCADPGEATQPDDCDDARAAYHPGAPEVVADGLDQDCDGADDCWVDADRDGHGGAVSAHGEDLDCDDLPGQTSDSDDCLDVGPGAAGVYPGASEVPANGVDEDCDGVDDCYADQDGDGFAGPGAVPGDDLVCGDGDGLFPRVTDCDDVGVGAELVHPGAPEACNGYDDDCDALIDGADPDGSGDAAWYPDADGDGYGRPGAFILSCTPPPGYSPSDADCDDLGPRAADAHPGADEVVADGVDQDCDGADDCWLDADGDGFGGLTSGPGDDRVCGDAPGEAAASDDCLDVGPGAASVFPGAAEVCNGRDDDCDGRVDDDDIDRVGGSTWYLDADQDGYAGAGVTRVRCGMPDGYLAEPTDCQDASPSIHPGAVELPGDGVDQDCDGGDLCFADQDGDGFGTLTSVPSVNTLCGDAPGEADNDDDCRDVGAGAAAIHPGAAERCDSVDDDCDGRVDDDDDDVVDGATWYGDLDG
ncbi:MAG TPA: MopE-related protein, partial [Myxococcota bacterium]|nr:MopE-related protein [Myxococcota bacterium]